MSGEVHLEMHRLDAVSARLWTTE